MNMLDLVLLIATMLRVVAVVQDATAPTCGPSELRSDRLVPQEIEGGLLFSGDGQDVVTEPFMLPEGPTILTAEMAIPNDYTVNRVKVFVPQGSTAETSDSLLISEYGSYIGSVGITMQSAGEVFLGIEPGGAWIVTLETPSP